MAAFSWCCTVKGAVAQEGGVTSGKGKGGRSQIFPTWRLWLIACLLAALFTPSAALADWTLNPKIATHETWIYRPNSMLNGSDKRGLMVVLHGCIQTHDQLKQAGNLEQAAEDHGLVMAVPYVKPDTYLANCWDYNGSADNPEHQNVAEIIQLANELKPRGDLKIDPSRVYVVGLSSGAALALKLGCNAPDVFAGIGAIAGPSVGSDQMHAIDDQVPATNVPDAIKACKSLASGKESFFANQIANIAYGNMDLNGVKALFPKSLECELNQNNPGKNCVASIQWSKDNIDILKNIYNTGDLGAETNIQSGKGVEQSATAAGKDSAEPAGH